MVDRQKPTRSRERLLRRGRRHRLRCAQASRNRADQRCLAEPSRSWSRCRRWPRAHRSEVSARGRAAGRALAAELGDHRNRATGSPALALGRVAVQLRLSARRPAGPRAGRLRVDRCVAARRSSAETLYTGSGMSAIAAVVTALLRAAWRSRGDRAARLLQRNARAAAEPSQPRGDRAAFVAQAAWHRGRPALRGSC